MATEKLNLMLEAERRGILPPQGQALLDEARRRGLLPGFAAPGANAAPAPAAAATMATSGPVTSPGRTPGTPANIVYPLAEGRRVAATPGGVTVPLPDTVRAAAPPPAADLGIPEVSAGQGVARGFSRQFLDNLLAVPELAAELATRSLTPRPFGTGPGEGLGPIEAVGAGMKFMTGGAVDPAAAAARVRGRLDAGGQIIDMPSAAEVSAATDTALQLPGALLRGEAPAPGARFDAALERQQVSDIRGREAAPVSTAVGEVGGDIATILATRGLGRGAAGSAVLPRAAANSTMAAPAQAAQTVLGRMVQSTGRALATAGGRAAETGLEAAFLAALKDADPLTVGGTAAGIQAAGDLARPTFLRLIKPKNLFTAVGVATIASLGLQQLTPGGLDRLLPTIEAKNKEAVIALLLSGGVTGLTGRVPSGFAGPATAEIASAIPRGVLMSALTALNQDPARVGPVLQKFAEDPDFFGAKARRLLTRALTADGADLAATVESLMDGRDFRQRFLAIGGTVGDADLVRGAVSDDTRGREWRGAGDVAQAAADQLGRRAAGEFGWGVASVGPRRFVNRALEGGAGKALADRLDAEDFAELLAVDLEGRLLGATVKDGDRKVIDGDRLERAWRRLPKVSRDLFPEGTEDAVLALAERARKSAIGGGLPPRMARALLAPRGRLRGLLFNKTENEEASP